MSEQDKGADSTEENLEEGENLEENTSEEDDSQDEESKKFEDQKRRAEKAEAKLEELKKRLSSDDNEEDEDKDTLKDSGSLTKEEAKLIARGLSDEEIEKADKIAQVEGVSLTEAVGTDLFETWKEKRDKEIKAQEASIGASKGSGSQKKGKSLSDPNLEDKDHEKLAKERLGY